MNHLLKVIKDKPLDSPLTARYNDDRQLASGKDLPLQDQRISETLHTHGSKHQRIILELITTTM